ncbi:S9 family peptidase [Demequina zhanjiangensis]|uniref:S9 family peptidase n=1 Tax=Demequina zhanjiangensis TaxID=3051659 RepID=A0ABT8FZH7_9MICO|nr:S9 family peptidase [Demequina sp. SYSU T00b26]MDN4472119.1 S9 family peptidase [Demequina sp. SYSU T00b26]
MPTTPFDSLDDYISIPRVEGLALSPDGARAALTVASLSEDKTSYERALWAVPADGSGTPVRLTRSAKGEGGAAYTSAGDLLFVSARPGAGEDDVPQLWVLPAAGGEARPVTALAGGVSGLVAVAESAPVVVIAAPLMRSAETLEDDTKIRADRKKKKVNAILHEAYPVRHWDHDLGPDETHLLAIDLSDLPAETPGMENAEMPSDGPAPYPGWLPRPVDLTPHPGRSADVDGAALSADGTTLVAAMPTPEGRGSRARLVSIDVATGAHTVLFDEAHVDHAVPAISPDGSMLAHIRMPKADPNGPTDQELWLSGIDGSQPRRVAEGWDRWPGEIAFTVDGTALITATDQDGRAPIFRIPLDGSPVETVVADDNAYTAVALDRTGAGLVALRSSYMAPAHPVRVDFDGAVTEFATPAPVPAVPGTLTEVETVAEDGARVRAWLVLPDGASAEKPAPLLLWIHGGPLGSWNAWSWRWNPLLAAARGYAVLLPDPALSTGYGLDFIARGWNSWGDKPFTDLMSITDAAVARDDIDEQRTAAMGGSFGGYMANWVAGHTDRFKAIVTHASLWAMDQFGPTTDHAEYWQEIFTPESALENSPHRFVQDIVSPMLIIHGDKDYRVPIGEGLRLWAELSAHFMDEDGSMPHKFLYFPDENHWILKPQHAVVWYETVFAFLGEHVLHQMPERPSILG